MKHTNLFNEIYTPEKKESNLEVIAGALMTIVLVGIILAFIVMFN